MKPINYLRGVTKVFLEGVTPTSAINKITSRDILIWDVAQADNGTTACIHTKNAKKLKKIYPKAVLTGTGMPQTVRKLGRRWLLVVLSLVLFGAWWLSGQMIWELSVSGNSEVPDYEILRVMEENGVGIGTVAISVKSEKLSNIMLREIPELSWFAVNVRGCRAEVKVRERVSVPEIVDPYELKNVYAEKSGTVLSAEVYDGTRLVGVGDEVQKGDMLVSGITESFTGTRNEHALARIYAETRYEIAAVMPQSAQMKNLTGEKDRKIAIEVCSHRINLYRDGGCSFENCEMSRKVNQFTVFGVKLPIKIITVTHLECETRPEVLTEEQCGEILKAELSDMLRKECTGEVLAASFDSVCENGTVTVTLSARCRERIA